MLKIWLKLGIPYDIPCIEKLLIYGGKIDSLELEDRLAEVLSH